MGVKGFNYAEDNKADKERKKFEEEGITSKKEFQEINHTRDANDINIILSEL